MWQYLILIHVATLACIGDQARKQDPVFIRDPASISLRPVSGAQLITMTRLLSEFYVNDVGQFVLTRHICCAGNCIGIADFSYMNGCLDLYDQARDFIYYNFTEVSKSDEYLQLSQPQLLQVI